MTRLSFISASVSAFTLIRTLPTTSFVPPIAIEQRKSSTYLLSFNPKKSPSVGTNGDENDANYIHGMCRSRRDVLTKLVPVLSLFISLTSSGAKDASAFENKISNKYDDRPKRKGPQPNDLGIAPRKTMDGDLYQGLKQCGPAPNCFSSTDIAEEDPSHVIPPWKWPSSSSSSSGSFTKKEAFEQLELAIRNEYVPGQNNVDGGGFKVIKYDIDKGYLYVQFESLKNGYIDDFEIAYLDNKDAAGPQGSDRMVQVRSSSRVGWLDYGVNAKRVNFIAKTLREKGWDAPGVDYATHQDYVQENNLRATS